MNSITIISKEISSLKEMDSMFEGYCRNKGITLDFTRGPDYNAYSVSETANAFIWFLHGTFNCIGDEHLRSLL